MTESRWFWVLPLLAFALLARLPAYAAASGGAVVLKQGEATLITVDLPHVSGDLEGQLDGRKFPFFAIDGTGRYGGLVAADMALKPSRYELVVRSLSGREQRRLLVRVVAAKFGTERLELPEDKVELDSETLVRVEREQEAMLAALAPVGASRLWAGAFVQPVDGRVRGSFGQTRVINGKPRSPHSGEDISAPKGTPVLAANAGQVVVSSEMFFSGKSVVIDHGQGIYTMYFHLDEVDVQAGYRVEKGARIGAVGSTGRATGPHLHWGARVSGARVNPFSILSLQLP